MNGFTLLWSKILDSSIWMESKETRIVWITMLAMKDKDGLVRAAPIALAHRARVSPEECHEALETLKAPDPQSMTPDNDGRRIREVPGGWQILNHELYRFSTEAKREFWRQQKAEQRRKLSTTETPKTKETKKAREARLTAEARERRFLRAEEKGDHAEAERILEEGIPQREQDFPVSEQPSSNHPEPDYPELQ
jgi:hypothetical protein